MGDTTAMTPVMRRIVERTIESPETTSLVVEDDAADRCEPGRFHMLWSPGVGEVPISVSRIGARRITFTIRSVGATTTALCGAETGDTIGARGPFGRPWDLDVARGSHLVVIAGGLGLAPVRPAIEAALTSPEHYRSITVLVGARTPEDILYPDDLAAWGSGARVACSVDLARTPWTGIIGPVTALLDGAVQDPADTHVLMCGPEIMMRVVGDALALAEIPGERVQLSLERTMHCGVGHCGHCQLGPMLTCVDGPVTTWTRIAATLSVAQR
jgi:NAD(P)H-flavin reductase